MATLHGDLGLILKRVEDTEEKLDTHAVEIKKLKKQRKNYKWSRGTCCIDWKTRKAKIEGRKKNLRTAGNSAGK